MAKKSKADPAPEAAQSAAPDAGGEALDNTTPLSDARSDIRPTGTQRLDEGDDGPQVLEGKDFAYHKRSEMLKEIARSAAAREETTEGDITTNEQGEEVFTPAAASAKPAEAAQPAGDADAGEPAAAADTAAPAEGVPQGGEPQGTAPVEPDPTKFRKVKVNGQEQYIPIEQIVERGIAAFQKETAADANLNLAAQILEQARTLQQPKPQPAKTQEQAAHDQLIVETAKRIQFGTPEDAQQALMDFRNTIANEVATHVASQARTHTVAIIDQREAAKNFGNQYPDVVSDPNLLELAFTMEDRMRRMGDTRPWGTVYNEIGKELRTRYVPKEKWPATATGAAPAQGAPQGGSMAPSQARVERKESATAAVAGQGGGAPAKPQPKPLTPSQAIAKMAKARGQTID